MTSHYEYDGVIVIVKDTKSRDDSVTPVLYFAIDPETKIVDLQVYGFLKESAHDEGMRMKYVPTFVKYVKSQREERAKEGSSDLTFV